MLFKVVNDKEIHIIKSQNAQTLVELSNSIPQLFKQYPKSFYLAYIDEDGDEITLETESDYNILLRNGYKSAKILLKQKIHDFQDDTRKIQIVEEPRKETMSQIEQLMKNDFQLNEQSEIKISSEQASLDQTIQEKLKSMLPEIIKKIKSEVSLEITNRSSISEPQIKKSQSIKIIHRWVNCDGCGQRGIEGIRYKCAICPDFDFCENCQANIEHPHPFLKIKNLTQTPIRLSATLADRSNVRCPAFNGFMSNQLNCGQEFIKAGKCPYLAKQEKQDQKQQKQQKCPYLARQQKQEQKQDQQKKEKKQVIEQKNEKNDKKQELISKGDVKPQPKVRIQTNVQLVELIPAVKQKQSPKYDTIAKAKDQKIQKQQKEVRVIDNANYLADVLEVNFTRCYKFSAKNPEVTKQQLLELYFIEKRI